MIHNQVFFTKNNITKLRHLRKNRKLYHQPKQSSPEMVDTQFFIKGKSIQINKINCPLPISDSQNIQNIDNTVEVPSEKQSENQKLKLENQKRKNRFRVKKLGFCYLNSKDTTLDNNILSSRQNHQQILSNYNDFDSENTYLDNNLISSGQKKSQQIQSCCNPSQQNSNLLLKSKSENKNNLEISQSPHQKFFKFPRNSIKMITYFNHKKQQEPIIRYEDQEIDNKIQRKKQQQQQYFSINYSEDQQKQKFIPGQQSDTKNEASEDNDNIFKKGLKLKNLDQSLCMQLLNYVLKRNHLDIFCINFGWFRRMKEVRLYQLKQFLYLHPKHKDIFPIIYRYESILHSFSINYVKYLSNQMRNQLD